MKEWLLRAGVLVWLVAVTVSVISVITFADSFHEVDRDQLQLENQLQQLKAEHEALQLWVNNQLRPWLAKQAKEQADALPSSAPEPSVPPLPPLPTVSPAPTATSPTPTPPSPTTSPLPTVIPTPSSICLPVLHICEGG